MPSQDIISIYAPGHWDIYDSYGLIACQLSRQLHQLGVYVNAMSIGNKHVDNQPVDVEYIVNRPIKASLGGIALGYPTTYKHFGHLLLGGTPRIALTMFESSKIPPNWVPILNMFDAVITPSAFCKDVFQACGVRSPVYKVPLGVSDVFRPHTRKEKEHITFLAFLDRGRRKGGAIALRAFVRAFGEDKKYKLILKGRSTNRPMEILNPNIEVIQQDYTEEELYSLYKRCDVLLNPTLGEGFGLIPREFAATGGIALTTPWGGTADDLQNWGWGLPYTLTQSNWTGIKRFEKLDLGVWAEPVVEGIVDVLQEVARNFSAYRRKAMEHSSRVRAMYTWGCFGRQTLNIWRNCYGNSHAA